MKTFNTLILAGLILLIGATSAQANPKLQKVIDSMVDRLEKKCANNKEPTAGKMPNDVYTRYEYQLKKVQRKIRRYAECECFPAKLKAMDTKNYTGDDGEKMKKKFLAEVRTLALKCSTQASKNYFIPLCQVMLTPETNDPQKIATACSCQEKFIKQLSDDELIQYSQDMQKRYKDAIKENKATLKAGHSELTKKIDQEVERCLVLANIEKDSVYKKSFMQQQKNKASIPLVKSELRTIANTLDLYKLDNYKYPTTEQGLKSLLQKNKRGGPYLKKLPQDPWGHEYQYRLSDKGYELFSYGADGKPGGEGINKDINYDDE